MAVRQWPAYLLRGIPPQLREAMTANADLHDISLADVVRQALCARYRMDCDPASYGYQATTDTGNDVLIIRVQPEVWRLIKKETRGKYGRTRTLILASLHDYLEEQTQ